MKALVNKYLEDVKQYEEYLEKIPAHAWSFKPGPGKWSIQEIVIHVTDAEVNGFIRLRKALAEDGAAIVAYEQDQWATELNYAGMDKAHCLRLFRLLREMNHRLLLTLKEKDWKKRYMHPEAGAVTVEKWLETYVNHLTNHMKQIQRNLDEMKS